MNCWKCNKKIGPRACSECHDKTVNAVVEELRRRREEEVARIAALEQALATACAEVKAWREWDIPKFLGPTGVRKATDANELCRKAMNP